MRILRVEITNYGAFKGTHAFTLTDRGLTIVLGDNRDEPRMDSNGAAKSTIFEAVDWCLFGVIPKGDHVDSIIHDSEDETKVVTYLDDDGAPLVIQRSKARKKSAELLYRWMGGKPVSYLDIKETQRVLETVLGLDREVFHATVFYAQMDLFHFADAKDAARMEVVTKIFNLSMVDGWLEIAKTKAKELEDQLNSESLELERLKGQASTLEQNMSSFRVEASRWEEERAQALRKAMTDLTQYNEYIERARGIVAYEPQVLANHQAVLTQQLPVHVDWSDFDRRISTAGAQAAEWAGKRATNQHMGKALRAKKEKLEAKGEGECPECGQPVTAAHLAAEIQKIDADLETLRSEWTEADTQTKHFEDEKRLLENNKEEQRRLHYEADKANMEKVREVERQLKDIEESKDYLAKAEPNAVAIQNAMAAKQDETNPWHERERQAQAQVQQAQSLVLAKRQSIEQQADTLRYYEFWKAAFGPKGIKSYVLDAKLQEMTDAANEWVRLLTGGTIWVRFESQKLGRSTKKFSNEIVIRVFRYNPDGSIIERNYKSWSGGEKRRVSWAIDFGLSRLIATRARKRYDILILDEVFKHVDAAGGEAVVEMLRHLRREKSSIFVIEHDADFKSQFENRVLVRKENGQSKILEESDARLEEQAQEEVAPQKAPRRPASKKKPGRAKKRKRVSSGKTV